jgi:hypothetical protein
MRIFNPFKPHICEFGTGGFAVRKLTCLGWGYLDASTKNYYDFWWSKRCAKYAVTVYPEFAVDRLRTYYEYKNKPFSKLYAY